MLVPIYYSVNLISHFHDNFLQLSNMIDPIPVKLNSPPTTPPPQINPIQLSQFNLCEELCCVLQVLQSQQKHIESVQASQPLGRGQCVFAN